MATMPARPSSPTHETRIPPAHTALRALSAQVSLGQPIGTSGARLLTHGDDAFVSRLSLCEAAQASLDIQYYIWESDATGATLMASVLRAADRGVRVRILLDDIHTRGKDRAIALVDLHPNVEIRLFNPFLDRQRRGLNLLTDLNRLNHRMHNKVFMADEGVAIVGGRNIADNYFGVNTTANFRDLDVLVVGPVVADLARSFDDYWHSRWAVPIGALIEQKVSLAQQARYRDVLARRLERRKGFPYPSGFERDTALEQVGARLAELSWGKVSAIVDPPTKVGNPGQSVIQKALDGLMHEVQDELLIETAYLIPTQKGLKRLGALRERGVRVRILTNSLASNDVVAAHAGYARYRRQLLVMGVELYEMRPDASEIARGWRPIAFRSKAALHTKAMAFDRKKLLVGSLNLDPRSFSINTEVALLFENPALTASAVHFMDAGVRPENAYRLEVREAEEPLEPTKLLWVLDFGSRRKVYYHEPRAGLWKRIAAALIGLLPFEGQL